jgi:hypothetical protein
LIFDSEKKTAVFEHENGEQSLRWTVRLATAFTMLNTFLSAAEYSYPIFGGWNGFSFTLCSLTGIVTLIACNIFSKRTVHKAYLFRSGDEVELLYFNAFWIAKSQRVHISEFANLQPSYIGFHRSELTTHGKIWINLEKNVYANDPAYERILTDIFSGKPIRLE